MNESYQNQAKARLITAVVAIVVIAGIVLLIEYFQNYSVANLSTSTSSNSSTSQRLSEPSGNTASTTYKDGTYMADSRYFVPHGLEDIKVTLTVKNNTVTDSRIENSESDPESAQFQEDFASQYKNYVVGKKIGAINLSYVAGASDTTSAFDDALNQIRNQAQV